MLKNKKKVFFYVQHLHGLGHVFRATRIAKALSKSNFEVHLIWGGKKVNSIDIEDLNVFYLPALYCNVDDFSTLLDENYKPVNESFLEKRKVMLLDYYSKVAPDIVITETFPFGRRQMRFELLPLMNMVYEQRKQNPRKVKVIASVRDIVQQNRKLKSQKDTLDYLKKYFDLILVHGDKRFTQITETVPGIESQASKIKYTGIVASKNKTTATLNKNTLNPEVLVSGGGGAAAYKLIETAIKASRLNKKFSKKWLITTGPYMSNEDFSKLQTLAPKHVTLVRFIDDFSQLIKKAKLSISLCGYNTAADILAAKIPAIITPSIAGLETEQLFRAKKLNSLGWAKMILPEELTPERLASELDQIDQLKNIDFDIDLNGAENSAKIISDFLQTDV